MKITTFKNAYGIKSLKTGELLISDCCIYASNGIFKTSFSKAIYEMTKGNGDVVSDRIRDIPFESEIDLFGNKVITNEILENVLVYSKEVYDELNVSDDEISTMLLLPEQQKKLVEHQKKLDDIYVKLNKSIVDLGIGGIKSLEDAYTLFGVNSGSKIDKIINFQRLVFNSDNLETDFINFKNFGQAAYSNIDDSNFKELATDYLNVRNRTINSELFDDQFTDLNYFDFMAEIKKVNFLTKRRTFVIKDKTFTNYQEFSAYVDSQVELIETTPEVKKRYNAMEKSLGNTKGAQDIKSYLNNANQVAVLSQGKEKIITSRFKSDLENLINESSQEELVELKKHIDALIQESTNLETKFESAIKIYNDRFNPVFSISIDNMAESKLGLGIPRLQFSHKDNTNKKYLEEEIMKFLSSGEKSALKILGFIVQYENFKDKDKVLVILDDIVETFDYGNRTAFIEYLKDIRDNKSKIIVLTHNFDFFRVVTERIKSMKRLSARVNADGKVYIEEASNIVLQSSNLAKIVEPWHLISLIPFVREVVELKEGKSDDYYFLTNLLHYKETTANITMFEIKEVISRHFKLSGSYVPEGLYYDILDQVSFDDILQFEIKKKLVLSIKLRVLFERKVVNNDWERLVGQRKDQMNWLFEEYNSEMTKEGKSIFHSIQLLTPQYLHFNTFLYEPLIDTDPYRLVQLLEKLEQEVVLV